MKREQEKKIIDIIQKSLGGQIHSDETIWLDRILSTSPEAVRLYVEVLANHTALNECKINVSPSVFRDASGGFRPASRPETDIPIGGTSRVADFQEVHHTRQGDDIESIRCYAEQQLSTFLTEQEKLKQTQAQRIKAREFNLLPILQGLSRRAEKTVSFIARSTVRLAVLAAVLLVLMGIVEYIRSQRVVAVLSDQVEAQWDVAPDSNTLRPGLLSLKTGFSRIIFNKGAEVIVQGPCEFELRSPNLMYLWSGSVCAKVPPQAKGFRIDTWDGAITDFGTEFGVAVETQSAVEVHVFEGQVRLDAPKNRTRRKVRKTLYAGQAAILELDKALRIQSLAGRSRKFVRHMPGTAPVLNRTVRYLDLSDVVGGGNGFGAGSQELIINPANGRTIDKRSGRLQSGAGYVVTPWRPYIDGVFVVPAASHPFPVSSAGHRFRFPPCQGKWWVGIDNRQDHQFMTLDADHLANLIRDYRVQPDKAFSNLLLHANVGVTFDLHALRQSLGSVRIVAFRALCGLRKGHGEFRVVDAEFHVLVDGQSRFQERVVVETTPVVPVHVALGDEERFLTLACTEGTDMGAAWGLFGEPVLQLE